MDNILASEPTAEESAELQAQIGRYLTEMKRLNEQMAHDQERIDTLKAESCLIAAETRVLMANLHDTLVELGAA